MALPADDVDAGARFRVDAFNATPTSAARLASRFLAHATFGPTRGTIAALVAAAGGDADGDAAAAAVDAVAREWIADQVSSKD